VHLASERVYERLLVVSTVTKTQMKAFLFLVLLLMVS